MERQICNAIIKILYSFFAALDSLKEFVLLRYYSSKIARCGKNFRIDVLHSHYAGLSNFYIGDNVYVPHGAVFYSTNANLIIGNNVMFGPNPTIITGDHRFNVVGTLMNEIKEKETCDDKDVIIEDEVWVGANVTILKGVTIGRGSIIGACSTIAKSCPPYSIVVGTPAKVIKYRFTIEEILEHESKVYPIEKRLSIDQLIDSRLV